MGPRRRPAPTCRTPSRLHGPRPSSGRTSRRQPFGTHPRSRGQIFRPGLHPADVRDALSVGEAATFGEHGRVGVEADRLLEEVGESNGEDARAAANVEEPPLPSSPVPRPEPPRAAASRPAYRADNARRRPRRSWGRTTPPQDARVPARDSTFCQQGARVFARRVCGRVVTERLLCRAARGRRGCELRRRLRRIERARPQRRCEGGYGRLEPLPPVRGHGSPTVVLDAGLHTGHTVWAPVERPVAQRTRTCSYDRSGVGQSDLRPSRPALVPAEQVVDELHSLLDKADVSPPYVLVGHSIGGLNARLFTARHPRETSGLVLVDPTSPEYFGRSQSEPSSRGSDRLRHCLRHGQLGAVRQSAGNRPLRLVIARDR